MAIAGSKAFLLEPIFPTTETMDAKHIYKLVKPSRKHLKSLGCPDSKIMNDNCGSERLLEKIYRRKTGFPRVGCPPHAVNRINKKVLQIQYYNNIKERSKELQKSIRRGKISQCVKSSIIRQSAKAAVKKQFVCTYVTFQ